SLCPAYDIYPTSLIPRIEIFARGGRRGHVVGARAMRPAAPARETLAATTLFIAAGCAIHLRLRAGDEGGQPIDPAAGIGNYRLRLGLRLKLRLRPVLAFAMVLARLLVALVGLAFAALLTRIVVADVGLRLLRDEARLLAEMREALALVVAVFRRRRFVVDTRLRLVLPELLLGSGDQAEIMLGVLVVILGRDRVAGRARVARQLDVFFGDVRGGAANLDIGSVRFEHPGHRVLTTPVIVVVIVIIIPVTHPLVVLTVSHVSPFIPALKLCSCRRSLIQPGARSSAPNHDAVQIHAV